MPSTAKVNINKLKIIKMTIWFNKKNNGVKRYCSKSVSFRYNPQHWKLLQWKSNGAVKGRKEDTCYDLNIYFLGFFFGYTNWDYNFGIS